MSDVLARIRQHTESLGDRVTSIPEWGLNKVYLKRQSVADFERMQTDLRDAGSDTRTRVQARLLINHCVDEDGNKIFDGPNALGILCAAENRIVNRVAKEIIGERPILSAAPKDDGESEAEQEKNG